MPCAVVSRGHFGETRGRGIHNKTAHRNLSIIARGIGDLDFTLILKVWLQNILDPTTFIKLRINTRVLTKISFRYLRIYKSKHLRPQ